jgi:AraC-like DNA-binding protein
MHHNNIKSSELQNTKSWGNAKYIEDDIIIVDDISTALIPKDPRRMNFLILALCTEGEATYTLDTQEMRIQKNDVLLILDRHVVSNFTASKDLKALCIIISVKFFFESIRNVGDVSSLLLLSRNFPVIKLAQEETETFQSYFYLLKTKAADKQNKYRRKLVSTLILAMFYDLSNVVQRMLNTDSMRQTRAEIIFTKFIKLLEGNFKQERRVGWYAEQLNITPKYLSETIKNVSRRTPNDWIDNYVTIEMRIQLRNSTKSIKEIAEEMNFANQSFLGKYFKEHVGISPSEYRKNKS